jgi:hypothetical protein
MKGDFPHSGHFDVTDRLLCKIADAARMPAIAAKRHHPAMKPTIARQDPTNAVTLKRSSVFRLGMATG